MIFKVDRTSLWDRKEQPCVGATRGTIAVWDFRTFKSPEEHDKSPCHFGRWHERGTDHDFIYGPRGGVQGIKRRLGDEPAWFIEIDSLAELIAFTDKYGDVILTTADEDGETLEIEIYDGYRE